MTPSAVTRAALSSAPLSRANQSPTTKQNLPGLAFEENPQLTHPQRNFLRVGERLLSGQLAIGSSVNGYL
jgi:hypothetical protein